MTENDQHAWGNEETQYFFELGPERILSAVESGGLRCTGRCVALNSMENRVYELEIDLGPDVRTKSVSDRFRIVKFYRPGRWSEEQILEEHRFISELKEYDIPVVSPLPFDDGSTLKKMPDIDIFYTVFPKAGGRIPEELSDEQLSRVGRLLARLHNVGVVSEAPSRIQLSPTTYGLNNLDYLLDSETIDEELEAAYEDVVLDICETSKPWFDEVRVQRVHGDCHLGNILWSEDGPTLVDFDDMVRGPRVQDLWLLLPGRDDEARRQLKVLLEAYQSMSEFDYSSLRLIEPLRALRMVHFSCWIAKRYQDPAFINAFPDFGSARYWREELDALREQLSLIASNELVWA